MLLYTNKRPLSQIIIEHALLLGEKIIKIPGCMSVVWMVDWGIMSLLRLNVNLRTQRGFVQGVADFISHFGIDFGAQQFLLPRNTIEPNTYSINLR
ncbi:hypothetical protein CDAR_194481 [Caerostris darwini]|uniref:Uncharacterized protein n=1 Tax=Caerostris darwini TaxID=1538125 RepID=A0AAV4TK69_9ARAC|nr:hypothetical protein CDAR_194481 [Caerostris darwini]